jgi:ataxia telangiectasia mutated family protein
MLMLLGLDPLIRGGANIDPDQSWDDMLLAPDEGTGIKRKILSSLKSRKERRIAETQSRRREIQRIIFQSADVSIMTKLEKSMY